MAQDRPGGTRRPYQGEAMRLLQRLQELGAKPSVSDVGHSDEIKTIQDRLEALRSRDNWDAAWKTVQLVRHQDRPQTLDYISQGISDFIELHGDRLGADDKAIVAGLGFLGERRVVVIGHQKGHDLKERQERTFGMARPEGYRKAQRVARLAEKFGLPVVTLIDTMGAYPGRDAEEGGQARAIASSMEVFASLTVPTVAVVIGEGESGGALALALTDRVFMLENSIYSVISPEGCAGILWRDAADVPKAAAALRLTAPDALEMGLIDGVIPEPTDGAQTDHRMAARRVWREVCLALGELERIDAAERLHFRRAKYLAMGSYRTVE